VVLDAGRVFRGADLSGMESYVLRANGGSALSILLM
jgi:hypothetical protein